MAEPEVATKAPESDAQAESGDPTPSAADTSQSSAPALGEHCTTAPPLPASHSTSQPRGETTEFDGVECYVTKPDSYPHSPAKLLLLLTGGTGVHSVNNRLQADEWTARGYVVVMPDQFEGDAAPASTTTAAVAASPSQPNSPTILERVRLGAAETAKSFIIDMWLARHTQEKVIPILNKVLNVAKERFGDSIANGGGIYGVGYCFGAKYILQLCGTTPPTDKSQSQQDVESADGDKKPELKAGAIAHGTLITQEDFEQVKSPVALICVQGDNLFPDEIREHGKATLELNTVEYNIKIYGDVPHGFAVLGDYGEQHIQQAQKDAFEEMASWLEKH